MSLIELVVVECFYICRNLLRDFGYGKLNCVFAIIYLTLYVAQVLASSSP